jgi:Domain of unknown function (DUF4260)
MAGATVGGVRTLLRLEGVCVCAASVFAYSKLGASWAVFFSCFLLPDLSFLGYFGGQRVGASSYNAAHSYIGAVACLVLSLALNSQLAMIVGLIWSAHIGFDRSLGYGLKYAHGFSFTHLGLIGRAAREVSVSLAEPSATQKTFSQPD